MTKSDGKPCKKCGGNEWGKNRSCVTCKKEYDRQWAQNNHEKINSCTERYRQRHPDRVSRSRQHYRLKNAEQKKADNHRRRTKITTAGGSFTTAEWKTLLEHYDHKCLCCGRDDVKLTADHIVPVSKGGTSNINNIQPLCGICNSRKGDRALDYRPDSGPLRWIQRKLFG